jgi:large subunit ribosomal protein L21
MQAYAVIETGGKQYRVEKDVVLEIELLDAKEGDEVALDAVLAVSDGENLTVGTPRVEGALVKARVIDKEVKDRKVVAFKKKRRKGYKRKVGHRQKHTKIQIAEICAG